MTTELLMMIEKAMELKGHRDEIRIYGYDKDDMKVSVFYGVDGSIVDTFRIENGEVIRTRSYR